MMTPEDLVAAGISKLNEIKKTNIKIISIKDEDSFIDVIIKYPKAVESQKFGFTSAGFDPQSLQIEGHSGMTGFTVPDKLRILNPDAVIILRIAFYFGSYGKGGNYI